MDYEDIEVQIQWLKNHVPLSLEQFLDHFYPSSHVHGIEQIRYLHAHGFPLNIQPALSSSSDRLPLSTQEYLLKLDLFDWLNAEDIYQKCLERQLVDQNHLSNSAQLSLEQVHARSWVDSTQTWANKQLKSQPMVKSGQARVYLTEYQSAGRGRLGRHWLAPFGSGLMMTLAVQLHQSRVSQHLSPLIALHICDALRQACGLPIQVKWPNDLYLNGAKLAGCLIQTDGVSLNANGAVSLLVGLGLNLSFSNRPSPGQMATGLWDGVPCDRQLAKNDVAAIVIHALLNSLATEGDMTELVSQWSEYDTFFGKAVRLSMPNGDQVSGVSQGIDSSGQLKMQLQTGEIKVFGVGEVSLRALAQER